MQYIDSDTDLDDDELRCYLKKDNGEYMEIGTERDLMEGKLRHMVFFRKSGDQMIQITYEQVIASVRVCMNEVRKRLSKSNRIDENNRRRLISKSRRRRVSIMNKPIEYSSDSTNISESDASVAPKCYDIHSEGNCNANKYSIDTEHINNQHTKILSVSPSRVNIIRKWLAKNDNFLPRENRRKRLVTMFQTNTNFFMQILYTFNPIVKIPYLFSIINKYSRNDYSPGKKDEFLHTLKLTKTPYLLKGDSQSSVEKISQNGYSFRMNDFENNYKPEGTLTILNFPNHEKKNSENGDVHSKIESSGSVNGEKKENKFPKKDWIHKDKFIAEFSSTFKKKLLKSTDNLSKNPNPVLNGTYKIEKGGTFRNYTIDEDRIILNWVLKRNHAYLVNGNKIWKDLEERKLFPLARSWHSLRNRFLRVIMFNLRDYNLSSDDEMRIKVGAEKGCINKKNIYKKSNEPSKKPKLIRINGKENANHAPEKRSQSLDLFDIESYNNYSDTDIIDDAFPESYKDVNERDSGKKRKLFSSKTSYIENGNSSTNN